jgi:hypothetical protein
MTHAYSLKTSFLLCLAVAVGEPNFSGTWIRDIENSDKMATFLDGKVLTISADLIIKHVASTLTVQEKWDYKVPTNAAYTIDGKEHSSKDAQGDDITYQAQFEGNNLRIIEKGSGGGFGGADVTAIKTWEMSPDGRTLTITTTINSGLLGKTAKKQLYKKRD